jgi:hypothetical protein
MEENSSTEQIMQSMQNPQNTTNTTNTQIIQTDIPWNIDDDKILKEWVDKSACFKWLHEKSYKKYKKSYLNQMIPVIVISTLTGAANFSLNNVTDTTYRNYGSLIVGGFNIFAAMISTVSQFLKTSELKEGHNIAIKSWDKFNRNLKIELQRKPEERTPKRDLFNYAIKEFDRLNEISPDIPNTVIVDFNTLYKDSIDLIKPEITGHIIPSRIYDNSNDELNSNQNILTNINNHIEIDIETQTKNIYIEKFYSKYNRMPTTDEISEYIELKNYSLI